MTQDTIVPKGIGSHSHNSSQYYSLMISNRFKKCAFYQVKILQNEVKLSIILNQC
jgi:hypothetical protein